MNAGKAVRLLLLGFVIAVVAIGLLPFLIIYSWSDLYGLSELDPSSTPIAFLQKMLK
ncbi:hypothetical protein [Paenibacillus sp. OV219]|uniref:hypothetical protein n=1 Tax=Paenibacillus sp. OV219 TaxID=1884377 RepID=UPI0008B60271|nr:hypothetical protein [Paenibacillus sp. OV219]SEO96547.1 hypothetical protein SAMN05518847_113124 [Paenibacillus sp. OV219]